jgi:hypothetical protein
VRVMIGALGTIKMGLDQNRQLLPFHPLDTEIPVTIMINANKICEAQQVQNHSDNTCATYQECT